MVPFNRPIPESKQSSKISGGIRAVAQAEKAVQMALMLPSAAAIGWLAGAWADSRFHQKWIAIFGIVFGAIAGLVGVIRLVITSEKDSSSDSKTENGAGTGTSGLEP
ncbi:MAG: AtpZ/AtpI family protein [Terracidiphilus sp.]|jgi:F0F1-type ATP synthase assembly protein I